MEFAMNKNTSDEIRSWGSYTPLEDCDGYKIKRVSVNPGEKLSLQMHHHRSEQGFPFFNPRKEFGRSANILLIGIDPLDERYSYDEILTQIGQKGNIGVNYLIRHAAISLMLLRIHHFQIDQEQFAL